MRDMLSESFIAALERGDVAAVKRGLDEGVSPNGRDSELWPALMIASRAGHLDLVECLLAAGADVDGYAGLDDDEDTADVEIEVDGMTHFEEKQAYAALERASPLRVWREKLASKYGPDDSVLNLDACEDSLTTALVFGHGLIARTLIRAGAEVNDYTCPLILAAATGHVDSIELLLEAGAEIQPGDQAESPLLVATVRGHEDAVRALLAAGADVDVGEVSGVSPLMVIAAVGALDMARILVEAGADVQLETSDGHSALTAASEQGHRALYRYLVRSMRA